MNKVFFLLLLTALTGCMEERVVHSTWDEFAADARAQGAQVNVGGAAPAPPPAAPAGPVQDSNQAPGYTILLETFVGPERSRRAPQRIARLSREANLVDAWMRESGDKIYILRGRFVDPISPQAQAALEHTRNLTLDGLQPYRDVAIVPVPPETAAISAGQWDLRQFKGQERFTLQVAYYDENFAANYQQAAEKAAADLRARGEEAYYYHGPNLSLVTIGLFTDADFVTDANEIRVYGPRVTQLQKRFPNNLGDLPNLAQPPAPPPPGTPNSFLVKVPEW